MSEREKLPTAVRRSVLVEAGHRCAILTAPWRWTRLLLGVALGVVTYQALLSAPDSPGLEWYVAGDLTPLLQAARIVLAGGDPYPQMTMLYPMPALLTLTPLAWLPMRTAYALWGGLGAGLLVWAAVGRHGPHGMAVWFSWCANRAIILGQWTVWQYLGGLYPGWQVLAAAKPTLGLIVWCYRPTRWAFVGGLILVSVSFVIQPTWLTEWLGEGKGVNWYVPAILIWQGGGPLLLLATLRWRRPEGRLLAALAFVPHNYIWYDQLLVFLVPQRARELWALCVLSWVSRSVAHYFMARSGLAEPAGQATFRAPIVALMYLPALLMVLRRPNEGPAPTWLKRRIASWPTWIRGTPMPSEG
jgi:hypothetical protein